MSMEPIDIVSAIVALFVLLTSREIAAIVGPYAAVVVCACAGAALALSSSEEEMGFGKAAWYVSVRVLLAVVVTVSLAEFVQLMAPWAKPRYTLVPIAFGIGWIKDYNRVREFFGEMIARATAKRIDDGK